MWSDWLVICDCGFSLSALSCWRRKWHPTPLLLPGKSHGWRSLVGYNPWGCEELDTTERLHFLFWLSCIGEGNGNPLQCSCLESPRDGEPGGLPSMGSHRVGHNWSDLAAAALWCPLSVPTVLLWFLLPWMWGISSWLLQQTVAAAPYLGHGEAPLSRACVLSGIDRIGIITMRIDKRQK